VSSLLLDEVESFWDWSKHLREEEPLEKGAQTLVAVIFVLVVAHGLSLTLDSTSLLCCLVVAAATVVHHALGLLEEIHFL